MSESFPSQDTVNPEQLSAARARRQMARVGLNRASIERFLKQIIEDDLHAKTILSLSLGTLGVLHAASVCIHVVGRAMAWARGTAPKHAIKQFDRLLSNSNVTPWALARQWAAFILSDRKDALIAIDWTEFDKDDHSTLCAYLVTRHGRATPLLWKTVQKSTLAGRRNATEDELIARLREIIPEHVRTTILADRGFGDQKRYEQIRSLGFDYVIRFKQNVVLTTELGERRAAIDWLHPNGRMKLHTFMAVTLDCYIPAGVVLVQGKNMKEPWCLATSRTDSTAAELVKMYARRFTIEETFRDTKDIHFGLGLSATHIGDAKRRDRLLFVAAIAQVMLTLLGAAGERCGLDRMLKANTSKERTMSLYSQGLYWYSAIPALREDRLVLLMTAYADVLKEHAIFCELFGII